MTMVPQVLVIACGALAHDLLAITRRHELANVTVECLPATLHNRPDAIPDAVAARLRSAAGRYDHILVGYADCGTGGRLDDVCAAAGVERLTGAHCYEFFAGGSSFAALHDEDPATFYLTDFLVRNFDLLVIRGLGIDRHPQLLPTYFGNYRQVVYLAQNDDADLDRRAREAAATLGLTYRRILTGTGDLEPTVVEISRRASVMAS